MKSSLFNLILVIVSSTILFFIPACSENGSGVGEGTEQNPTYDITGYWNLHTLDDEGDQNGVTFLKFVMDEDGSLEVDESCQTEHPFVDGTVYGTSVNFTLDFGDTTVDGNTILFEGTVNSDNNLIEGTLTQNGNMADVELVRSLEHVCHPDDNNQVIGIYAEGDSSLKEIRANNTSSTCSEQIDESHYPLAQGSVSTGSTGDASTTSPIGAYFPLTCVSQSYRASKNNTMKNVQMINADGELYPGAIIQGQYLMDDPVQFVPVTYDRSKGLTVTVSGVTLPEGCSYSRTLEDATSYSAVHNAIQEILSCSGGPEGTAANFNYETDEVYSKSHFAFKLGLDGRYLGYSAANKFSIDTTSDSNHVVLSFWQVYYTVTISYPSSPQDMFENNTESCTNCDQMGSGNPPIYIYQVDYGRIIHYVMDSEFSQSDIKDTLEAAYNGLAGSAKLNSSMTYSNVADKSTVHYWGYGGNAGSTLEAITSTDMFTGVKNAIATAKAANYSSESPALPIRFTMKYLHNNTTAIQNMSVDYDMKSCHPEAASYYYEAYVSHINSHAYVKVGSSSSDLTTEIDKTSGSHSYIIQDDDCANDPLNPTCDRYIHYSLYNGDCFSSGVHFELLRNGSHMWTRHYSHGTSTCGEQYWAHIKTNLLTGDIDYESAEGYHSAHWESADWGWRSGY